MSATEQAKFLQDLASELNSKEIALPSFPDVVIKIRNALEDPTCSAERLANVARADPVLVSRVLMSANSAFHNRAGIEIVDLDLAISRLGFETVRNTAIALAVEQIFNASQHDELRDRLKTLWSDSMSRSAMCVALSMEAASVNSDSAYLCGLLHDVGKLYILTKARDYPEFLGDSDALETVMADWHPSIGRSIVAAWGFAEEISATLESGQTDDHIDNKVVGLADVVLASEALIGDDPQVCIAQDPLPAAVQKLNINSARLPTVLENYEKYQSLQRQAVGT